MVAKCLDDNKAKTSLKRWIRTVSNFIDLIQFHLVCKTLAKSSGIESERTVSDFRKRQRKFLCCVHQPHKQAREIRNFQVADLQRRLRNVQKSMMHVQSCCFADINRLLFCRSRCRRHRCCLSSPLLWSRNVATMVTWRHTSPLYMIVQASAFLNRTLCEWIFDNLCASHLLGQSVLYLVSWWNWIVVIDIISQLRPCPR